MHWSCCGLWMVAAGISAGVRPGPPRFTVVSSRAVLAGGSVAQGPDPGPAQPASVGWVAGQVRTSVCPIAAPRHLLTPPTSRRRRTPPRLFVSGRRRLAAASLDCASGPGCRLLTGERVFVPVCTMLLSRSVPARGGDTVRGPPPRRELHCMGGAQRSHHTPTWRASGQAVALCARRRVTHGACVLSYMDLQSALHLRPASNSLPWCSTSKRAASSRLPDAGRSHRMVGSNRRREPRGQLLAVAELPLTSRRDTARIPAAVET